MKKLIALLILLATFAAPAFAQQEILKASTAYPLIFGPVIDSSDHISPKTGISSFSLIKIGKGGGTGVTPSGTVTEVDATNLKGWYKIAGNATDSGTDGPIVLHAEASGADPFDTIVGVVVDFNPRSVPTVADVVAGLLDEPLSGHTTSGTTGKAIGDIDAHTDTEVAAIKAKTDSLTFSVGNQVDSNVLDYKSATAPSLVSGRFDASVGAVQSGVDFSATEKASIRTAASPAVQKNVAKEWPFKMTDAATGLPVTSGTPTCTVSYDAPNSFGSGPTASALSSLGISEVTMSGTNLNATYYTILRCALSGANDYLNVFVIQP